MNKQPEIIIENVKASPETLERIKENLTWVFKSFYFEEISERKAS